MKRPKNLSWGAEHFSLLTRNIILSTLAIVILTTGLYAQNKPYWTTDRQVAAVLNRIEIKTDNFRNQMQFALDRSIYNNTNTEDQLNGYINDFEQAADKLKSNFVYRTSVDGDVENLLQKAMFINSFMGTTRLNAVTQNQWNSLRTDLNTLSRYYSVAWNWNNAQPTNPLSYSVPYNSVQTTVSNLERNTNSFKRELDLALDRSSLNSTQSEDMINRYVSDFETATNTLKTKFQNGTSTSTDVENVLRKAYVIDGFMRDYRLNYRTENEWNTIRKELNNLAGYYAVSMSWNQTMPWNTQYDTRLDGTYRLNAALSDNVDSIIRSTVNMYYSGQNSERVSRNLQRRLTAPEYIAIDKNGNSITIASTGTGQATFQADGVARTETLGNRQVKVTGKTNYDSITLNYESDRMNDYYVSFMPMENGSLKITRRIFLENRNETVAVASIYDKVNTVADFSWVANQQVASQPMMNQPNNSTAQNKTFYIPNGTQVTGTLNENLSTKLLKEGDRFSLNVTSPSTYQSSTIYGYVSDVERSGRVSGRANITFNFEQIRLPDGSLYEFRGIVENVTDARGNRISVNNEGVARDGNQTNKTIVRSGIGAGVGAIIGAILGGGEGAAIGAAIGGGAGAGSVIAQGRDDLILEQGSQMTISSSAPASINNN